MYMHTRYHSSSITHKCHRTCEVSCAFVNNIEPFAMAYPIQAAWFGYRSPLFLSLPLRPPGNLIPDTTWLAADTMLAPIEPLAASQPNGMSIETLTVCEWCGEPIWSLAGVIGYPVDGQKACPGSLSSLTEGT
ncbi:hypothetical protein H0G86_009541 [Trichoderma simmonsii]|uniref:Uncharacterized protein n=1 Tax=Trichoderma simmonsii TaxID=1491479 RepID=A0A8G0PHA6_9HYPO|nr:hypothetical protein H0G86_009541 [Trichoderma simmonsii]